MAHPLGRRAGPGGKKGLWAPVRSAGGRVTLRRAHWPADHACVGDCTAGGPEGRRGVEDTALNQQHGRGSFSAARLLEERLACSLVNCKRGSVCATTSRRLAPAALHARRARRSKAWPCSFQTEESQGRRANEQAAAVASQSQGTGGGGRAVKTRIYRRTTTEQRRVCSFFLFPLSPHCV